MRCEGHGDGLFSRQQCQGGSVKQARPESPSRSGETNQDIRDPGGCYTDSSGTGYYQQLSDLRAAAVTAYVQQLCGVPLFHLLGPAATGVSDPAVSNETPQGNGGQSPCGREDFVNRGVAGQQN